MSETQQTDYSDLIERVGKAEGPDREIDLAIARWETGRDFRWSSVLRLFITDDEPGPRCLAERLEHYTSSLDAALSLVERKLPGWVWGVTSPDNPEDDPALQRQHFTARLRKSVVIIRAHAPTPALAVCLALLRALEEKGKA